MCCVRDVVNLSVVLYIPNAPNIMGGNTRPPAGARQQPVQSLATAVDFAAVDFHLFDNEDQFSAPSSQRPGA